MRRPVRNITQKDFAKRAARLEWQHMRRLSSDRSSPAHPLRWGMIAGCVTLLVAYWAAAPDRLRVILGHWLPVTQTDLVIAVGAGVCLGLVVGHGLRTLTKTGSRSQQSLAVVLGVAVAMGLWHLPPELWQTTWDQLDAQSRATLEQAYSTVTDIPAQAFGALDLPQP
ncbi:hypothetical protein [Sagittula sp. SSi028]|uniref:hypothetical protein n=1 Tax=Sagittula sp. SSi028 TaxID=3400636 RepID=UPI003AF75095